jgi:DNA-binding IclR family transcriptional regulator
LLAFADSQVQDLELGRVRSSEASRPNASADALEEQLEQIRSQLWATSVGEREEGVSAVATAIVDARDRVSAALSISAPTTRLAEERFEELRPPLEACAAEINALL